MRSRPETVLAIDDLMFSRQAGENQGAFNKDKLLAMAAELKLDMARFEPCLKNDQTQGRVQADTQEGQQVGLRGTPTVMAAPLWALCRSRTSALFARAGAQRAIDQGKPMAPHVRASGPALRLADAGLRPV